MRLLSLFSGIGAFEKALTNLGIDYELVGFSEVDKWAIQSYCAIHGADENLNLGDISKIKETDMPKADLITYGFPCQDVSIAGKQKGITCETRSGLLYEAERVINYIKPDYAIAENVKNLVGKRFKDDFDKLLKRLESYGYNNYWKVLNAKDYGVPQNRERVFIVSIRKDVDDGSFNFPKPIKLNKVLKDVLDNNVEDKYILNLPELIEPLENLDKNKQEKILNPLKNKTVNGWHYEQQVYNKNGIARTLKAGGGSGNTPKIIEKILPKVKVKEATKKGYDIATENDSINISFPKSKTRRGRVGKGVAQTLDTQCNQAILQKNPIKSDNSYTLRPNSNYVIRKLTPLECWRLMGFKDEDYWKARKRLEKVFYNGKDRSNSQMYKQAGNSIVVNVLEEIFKELF